MADEEIYEKLNDYTLSVTTDFGRQAGADPELRRIFNFKARQVTTVFTQWYSSSVANSMAIQKFSELDSLEEVELMWDKLKEMGGNPPELASTLPKTPFKPPSLNP